MRLFAVKCAKRALAVEKLGAPVMIGDLANLPDKYAMRPIVHTTGNIANDRAQTRPERRHAVQFVPITKDEPILATERATERLGHRFVVTAENIECKPA